MQRQFQIVVPISSFISCTFPFTEIAPHTHTEEKNEMKTRSTFICWRNFLPPPSVRGCDFISFNLFVPGSWLSVFSFVLLIRTCCHCCCCRRYCLIYLFPDSATRWTCAIACKNLNKKDGMPSPSGKPIPRDENFDHVRREIHFAESKSNRIFVPWNWQYPEANSPAVIQPEKHFGTLIYLCAMWSMSTSN